MSDRDFDSIAKRISSSGTVRTAGKIEFIRDQGPVRRDIRAVEFEWSPNSLKNLAKILWAAQRSHSYATSALRLFSKMPSSQFSPDGMLGGRGYIQTIKDLRKSLSQASELLSSFTDTLYDEVNATHWDKSETEDSKNLLEETEKVKENPEGFVEQAFMAEGDDDFMASSPVDMNPSPGDYGMPEEEESQEESEEQDAYGFSQQASYDKSLKKYLNKNVKLAGNSSIPVSTLPGPRITHIGPGESEYGFYNDPSAVPSDDPSLDGFRSDPYDSGDYIYEGEFADDKSAYYNPTRGDSTMLKTAGGYSMLPGSKNEILMPYYDRGVSESDVVWMDEHSTPPNPVVNKEEQRSSLNSGWIWKDVK